MASPLLSAWENFYVIVGSSAGALIGIQFVVITLISESEQHATLDSISAFGTPTVAHLCGALLISALMSAPWPSLHALSAALAVCGVVGLVYGAIVIRRARRQTDYHASREDWLWYQILPAALYLILGLGALFLHRRPETALFLVAAAALGLLFDGIRNAWDSVLYIVLQRRRHLANRSKR